MSLTTSKLGRRGPRKADPVISGDLELVETEIILIFVEFAMTLGLPKSMGQIYGLLFIAPEPMSMDTIRNRLSLSIGSVSQGLKQLRSFKAIRTVVLPGQRKDFYEAETELKRLISGFFREQIEPQGERMRGRLDGIRAIVENLDERDEHYQKRFTKLQNWQKTGTGVMGKLLKVLSLLEDSK